MCIRDRIKGNTPADQGRRGAVEDDIERAKKKGDKKLVAKLKEAEPDSGADRIRAYNLDEGKMKELHGYIEDGKSAEWIAKKMGVDVKTIKSLMSGYKEAYELGTNEYRAYLEKVTPGEVDEASARADAARAMRADPSMSSDPFSKDVEASPEDVKGAEKNIINQLRGLVSLRGIGKITLKPSEKKALQKKDSKYLKTLGSGFVEFEKGHEKVDLKVAQAVLNKFSSLKKPTDKVKFQAKVAKSYKDMLTALKEEVVNEGTWALPKTSKQKKELKKLLSKPLKAKDATDKLYDIIGDDDLFDQIDDFASTEPNADVRSMVKTAMKRLGIKEEVKETILDRIDRKLKERKNG